MGKTIRWLHLSDLHAGCRGEAAWWEAESLFEKHVREVVEEDGPPHLILFTGDLANTGAEKEYKLVDRFLVALNRWIGEAAGRRSPRPILLAVPGNHDVRRPQGMGLLPYRALDKLEKGRDDPDIAGIEDSLFSGKDEARRKAARGFLDPLLGPYRKWFERSVKPQFKGNSGTARLNLSTFPCDFLAELEIEGAPLAVVGLNSAWAHYDAGDFQGRIWLSAEQIQAALAPCKKEASPLKALDRPSILLLHHPPAWLGKRAKRTFDEDIAPPGRFAVCLFGHLHEGWAESHSLCGGQPRYFFQAPSMFGREDWGTAREERQIGCVWGSLSEGGVVKVRPMKRTIQGGAPALIDDPAFPGGQNGSQIAPIVYAVAPSHGSGKPEKADFTSYLRFVADETSWIKISGIGSGAGKAKAAQRYEIERLYTPLRARGLSEGTRRGKGKTPRDGMAAMEAVSREGRLSLKDILPRAKRLHIEGKPGAGKTTFLKLIASCLARDLLGGTCPGARSWRDRFLGLPGEARLPVFLKASHLVPLLSEDGPHRPDRSLLLDLIEKGRPKDTDGERWPSREAFRERLEDGKAILLLDGLDEVGDKALREKVLEILRDATKKWKSTAVVTSRPIPSDALSEMGFERVEIDDFDEPEVELFLKSWVRALYDVEGEEALPADGRTYADALRTAIVGSPGIRRLATNPVMLTCLCVVHWNEGRLPEGRSRVYRAVIRWLIASRTDLRKEKGYSDRTALLAFARLALNMMEASPPKTEITIEEAAAVVSPLFTGPMAGKDARDWLRFEAEWSGIVEEIAGGKLRFWHLTFEEYLAAYGLALLPGETWWDRVKDRLDDRSWRETVELLPGCLFEEGSESRVKPLLERVLGDAGDKKDIARVARSVGLAGTFLAALEVLDYHQDAGFAAEYEKARASAMAIFEKEGAQEVEENIRIAAAEALGRAGDSRFRRCRAFPGDLFLPVPTAGDKFFLGKFPVTVAEFEAFVEAKGYGQEKYWTDDGGVAWEVRRQNDWREPGSWGQQVEHPTRPVVNVSWYEARTYCRWLTEILRLSIEGLEARLPLEKEWVKAATHHLGGPYPWGPVEPNDLNANFGKGPGGAPTPVGIYPLGEGEHRHLDLAGNVWEWCEDQLPWEGIFQRWASKPFEGQTGRPLRGGCYWVDAEYLRVGARGRLPASYRVGSVGFRVCVAPASR